MRPKLSINMVRSVITFVEVSEVDVELAFFIVHVHIPGVGPWHVLILVAVAGSIDLNQQHSSLAQDVWNVDVVLFTLGGGQQLPKVFLAKLFRVDCSKLTGLVVLIGKFDARALNKVHRQCVSGARGSIVERGCLMGAHRVLSLVCFVC
jgi:hypothetical protein